MPHIEELTIQSSGEAELLGDCGEASVPLHCQMVQTFTILFGAMEAGVS